jgi:putative endonuclease
LKGTADVERKKYLSGKQVNRHCEQSEAIQLASRNFWFASSLSLLAMTKATAFRLFGFPSHHPLHLQGANMPDWHLYMIRTKTGELYTGVTRDVERRFAEHTVGGKRGAKYLRGRGPLQLVFQQKIGTRSEALKAEADIKKLSKQEKEAMVRLSPLKTL